MAHALKCNSSSAGHIIGHCEREKDKNGEFLKYHTKSNIDADLTHLNITLSADKSKSVRERYKERVSDIGIKRKDQVTMVDWVVTLPKELSGLSYEDQQAFFRSSAQFVAERYGQDNFMGAFMHFDESTPHVHIAFTPVRDNKFQAKNILNRKDLAKFHEDLVKHLQNDKALSFTVEKEYILNGITATNKSTEELKAEQKQEIEFLEERKFDLETEVKSLENKASTFSAAEKVEEELKEPLESELPEPKNNFITASKTYSDEQHKSLMDLIKSLKEAVLSLKDKVKEQYSEIMELKSRNIDLYRENNSLKVEIGKLKGENERMHNRYEKLKDTAWVKEKTDLLDANNSLQGENKELKEKALSEYDRGYYNARKERADEVKTLKAENDRLENVKERLFKTIEKATGINREEALDFHQKVHKLGKYKPQPQKDRGWDIER